MIDGDPKFIGACEVLTEQLSLSPRLGDARFVSTWQLPSMTCGWRSPTTSARSRGAVGPRWTLRDAEERWHPDGYRSLWADNGTYEADLNRALRLMPSYGCGRYVRCEPMPTSTSPPAVSCRDNRAQDLVGGDEERLQRPFHRSPSRPRHPAEQSHLNLWVAALDKLYQIGVDEAWWRRTRSHEGSAPSEGATAGGGA